MPQFPACRRHPSKICLPMSCYLHASRRAGLRPKAKKQATCAPGARSLLSAVGTRTKISWQRTRLRSGLVDSALLRVWLQRVSDRIAGVLSTKLLCDITSITSISLICDSTMRSDGCVVSCISRPRHSRSTVSSSSLLGDIGSATLQAYWAAPVSCCTAFDDPALLMTMLCRCRACCGVFVAVAEYRSARG